MVADGADGANDSDEAALSQALVLSTAHMASIVSFSLKVNKDVRDITLVSEFSLITAFIVLPPTSTPLTLGKNQNVF